MIVTVSREAILTADAILADVEAGQLQRALDTANQALATCANADVPMLLSMKCNAMVTLGQPLEALRVATTAREMALAQQAPILVAEAGLALCFALQSLEEHTRVFDITAEGEAIAREQGDFELLARVQRTLAISYSVLGHHDRALALLQGVLPLLEQHARNPARMFHARYSLITARSRLATTGDMSDADKQAALKALHREWTDFVTDAGAKNLVRLSAMALGNAGIAARFAGDLDAALITLRMALGLQYDIALRGHAAVTEGHVAATLQAMGKPHEAIDGFKRAIALFEGGNPRELAAAWEELADVYESVDDSRAALHAFKQARAFERKLHDEAAHIAAAKLEQKGEIARLAEQWTRLAAEDPLTALANRRAFDRALQARTDALRQGQHFAIVFFDLDHFKQINDRFGHAVGDEVLKRFARLLREGRRAADVAARMGGEEFALLLVGDSLAQAIAVAEKIRAAVCAFEWAVLAPALSVTVSAGVVCSVDHPSEAGGTERMLAVVDQRLYRAKHLGRNRVCGDDA